MLPLLLGAAAPVALAHTGAERGSDALIAPVAGQLSADQRPPISWADPKHRFGWVSTESPRRRYCSRNANVICATDDRGKHWRPVFYGQTTIFSYLRWSKNAGVVSTGAYSHAEFWTRDGGRHWWPTSAMYLGAYVEASTGYGAGPRFTVGRGVHGGRELRYAYSTLWFRVLGWLPTQPLTCTGAWIRLGAEGEQNGPRNVCSTVPVGGDGMTATPVGPAARLTVVVSTSGAARVRSDVAGIDCGTPPAPPPFAGTACAASFPRTITITLRASASLPTSVEWSGCTRVYPDPGSNTAPPLCQVTLTKATIVTATFHG